MFYSKLIGIPVIVACFFTGPELLSAQADDLGDEVMSVKLRDNLTMQLSEWFEFESAEVKYSRVWKHRYWLGTFKARKPGSFKLVVAMTEDLPETGGLQDSKLLEIGSNSSHPDRVDHGRTDSPCVGSFNRINKRSTL